MVTNQFPWCTRSYHTGVCEFWLRWREIPWTCEHVRVWTRVWTSIWNHTTLTKLTKLYLVTVVAVAVGWLHGYIYIYTHTYTHAVYYNYWWELYWWTNRWFVSSCLTNIARIHSVNIRQFAGFLTNKAHTNMDKHVSRRWKESNRRGGSEVRIWTAVGAYPIHERLFCEPSWNCPGSEVRIRTAVPSALMYLDRTFLGPLFRGPSL